MNPSPTLELSGEALPERHRLRRARASDAEAIHEVELVGQQSPWSLAVIAKELAVDWSRTWVVEDPDGTVCAYLCVWLVADEVHILNVVVHPRARRRGIARSLVSELMSEAARQTFTLVTLEVRVGNVGARSLYESTGFREIGRRAGYYSDNGEDAIVMACILEESAS